GHGASPTEPAVPLPRALPGSSGSGPRERLTDWRSEMAERVYGVTELVGTSTESWEKAAQAVIESTASTPRVARVVEHDVYIERGKPLTYRVKLELSFEEEQIIPSRSNDVDQSADVD